MLRIYLICGLQDTKNPNKHIAYHKCAAQWVNDLSSIYFKQKDNSRSENKTPSQTQS